MIENLKKNKLIKKIKWGKIYPQGTIIRQIGKNVDNQGYFNGYDKNGNMILLNVIDLKNGEYAVDSGLLKNKNEETVYSYAINFIKSPLAVKALSIVRAWTLFEKHKQLQADITKFVISSFIPELIIFWKKNDELYKLFIPIQQKFTIGRFRKVPSWNDVQKELFKSKLDLLTIGTHITYLANIPNVKLYNNQFYSIGKESHVETENSLKKEPFIFSATHGGHIKNIGEKADKKIFTVDAGSNNKGHGVDTPIHIVKPIVDALNSEYPEYIFLAVPGREALGTAEKF